MAASSSTVTSDRIPGAAIGACPLQHLEMTTLSSIGTGVLIPGTFVGSRPLQHLEVTAFSSIGTGVLVPGAAVSTRPLDQVQVATRGSERTIFTRLLASFFRRQRQKIEKA